MIITEYMENGSLDAFLRVCDCFILNPRMLVFRKLTGSWHPLYLVAFLNGAKEEGGEIENDVIFKDC